MTPSSPRTTAADPPVTTAASANSTFVGSGADFFGTASADASLGSFLGELSQPFLPAAPSASQPGGAAPAADSVSAAGAHHTRLPGFPPLLPPRCLGAVTRTTNTTGASARPRRSLGGSGSGPSSAATFASVTGPPRRPLAPLAAQPGMPVPTHQGRKWTVLADIKTVKPNHTREERAAFVLKDLGVPPTSIAAAYVLHVDQLFLISLRDEAAYETALERLTRGVPWVAAGGRRVFGHSTLDLCLNVRVDNVPFNVPLAVITGALADFGRVLTAKRGLLPGTVDIADGIVHCRMRLHPGVNLPDFIALELEGQVLDEVCRVMTDVHVKRCFKCGQANHIGLACRMAAKTIAQQGPVWTSVQYAEPVASGLPPPVGPGVPLVFPPQSRLGLAAVGGPPVVLPSVTVQRILVEKKGPETAGGQLNDTINLTGGLSARTTPLVTPPSAAPQEPSQELSMPLARSAAGTAQSRSRSPPDKNDPDYTPSSSRSSSNARGRLTASSLDLRMSASTGPPSGGRQRADRFSLLTPDSERIDDSESSAEEAESGMDQSQGWQQQESRRSSKRRAAMEANNSKKAKERRPASTPPAVRQPKPKKKQQPPPVDPSPPSSAGTGTGEAATPLSGRPSRE